ncbi:MAG: hypothetical protein R3F43_30600, partial [bacterium]
MSRTEEVGLAIVDLGDDLHPRADRRYGLVPASDARLALLPYPETRVKRADVTLHSLFIDDLPGFEAGSTGILVFGANTRDMEDLKDREAVCQLVDFPVKARSYAPDLGNRPVFRNLIFQDVLELSVRLVSVDAARAGEYARVRGILDGVDALSVIDPFLGIPLAQVATRLFNGVVGAYGAEDVALGGLPQLDAEPGPGVAFLRGGVY